MNSKPRPLCPYCQTPLRLPAVGTVSLEVPCPDCGALLSIEHRDGETIVSRQTAEAAPPRPGMAIPARPRLSMPGWLPRMGRRIQAGLREPLVLTWLAAGIAATVLGIAFYRAGTAPSAADVADPEPMPEDEPTDAAPTVDPPEILAAVMAPRPAPSEMFIEMPPLPPAATGRLPVIASQPEISSEPDWPALAEKGLAQRIVQFEQTTPVAFETIRGELAEIVGVPIRYAPEIEPIQTEVSLNGSDATMGGILEKLARQAGLSYRIDSRGILLESVEDRRETK